MAAGEEPIYCIADNGDVLAADGRTVNHYSDFVGVLDDHMRVLDDHIAMLEREETVIEGEAGI